MATKIYEHNIRLDFKCKDESQDTLTTRGQAFIRVFNNSASPITKLTLKDGVYKIYQIIPSTTLDSKYGFGFYWEKYIPSGYIDEAESVILPLYLKKEANILYVKSIRRNVIYDSYYDLEFESTVWYNHEEPFTNVNNEVYYDHCVTFVSDSVKDSVSVLYLHKIRFDCMHNLIDEGYMYMDILSESSEPFNSETIPIGSWPTYVDKDGSRIMFGNSINGSGFSIYGEISDGEQNKFLKTIKVGEFEIPNLLYSDYERRPSTWNERLLDSPLDPPDYDHPDYWKLTSDDVIQYGG